jgi:NTE family protein
MRKIISLIVILLLSLGANAVVLDTLQRPKVGLVLSGGGAKGFAHVGVLKVLEKLNIPIDYITGTSMGSIIGGFYSMGYNASQIEKMIREQNWDIVLTDYVYRRYIPLFDRDEYDRYAFSFPIKDRGVALPEGIVHGQNVLKLFSRYSLNYHSITDFSKLPIPFACAGADIVKGEEYIMNEGYLPLAMRASMSIPTLFTPVNYDDRLLVDGGMINNFPVIKAKKMGADIIIGVDVQKGKKTKEELKSMPDIMNQAIFFLGMDTYEKNKKLVDVYIKPNINGYSVADFYKADSLIKIGERAAKIMIPQLLELKKKLGNDYKIKRQNLIPPQPNDTLFIKQIKVKGLKKLSESQVLSRLHIKTPGKVTLKKLESGIDRLYASLNFKTVMYRLDGEDNKTLEITVEEKITNRFNVGIHYDSWGDASILLNTTYNNIFKKGSKISFDLKLAEKPRVIATYTINNGWKPGLRARLEYNNFSFYEYYEGNKVGGYLVDKYRADININSIISNAYSIGIGFRADYFESKPQVTNEAKYNTDEHYFSYYSFIRMDTHEKRYYPRKGMSMYGEYRLLVDESEKYKGDSPYSILYFDIKKPIRFSKNFTFIPQIYASGLLSASEDPPAVAMTMWGGIEQTKYLDNQIPFIGLRTMETLHKSGVVLRGDFQWEMWKKNYLILKTNVGKFDDFFSSSHTIMGAGLTFAYESVIGPMEATIMYSNENKKLTFLVNLGYWF